MKLTDSGASPPGTLVQGLGRAGHLLFNQRSGPQGMQGATERNVGLALTMAGPQGRSLWGLPVSSCPADPPARGFGPFLSRQTMRQGSWNFQPRGRFLWPWAKACLFPEQQAPREMGRGGAFL